MIGIQATKEQASTGLGAIARGFATLDAQISAYKSWLNAQTDEQLKAIGFSDGTVDPTDNDILMARTAIADAAQLQAIFRGEGALQSAKDFRTCLGRLWGMGAL